MKVKLYIVILVSIFFNAVIIAEDKYRGRISININENGGSTYTTYTGFDTSVDRDVIIYLRRYSGQKAKLLDGALHMDPSKVNKYHSILNIHEVNKDAFKAVINLYSNTIHHDSINSTGIAKANLIAKHEIEGALFTKNKYIFSDKDKPYQTIFLEFDKVFSVEEIKERFHQKQKSKP